MSSENQSWCACHSAGWLNDRGLIMLNTAVQIKGFPLAGLLANVSPQDLIQPKTTGGGLLSIVMVHDLAKLSLNFTKPDIQNLSKLVIGTGSMMTNDAAGNLTKPNIRSASLYSRLERATRQYGTGADDLAKLTTIVNQGFVVSGATAQEAENAIIQQSQ